MQHINIVADHGFLLDILVAYMIHRYVISAVHELIDLYYMSIVIYNVQNILDLYLTHILHF